MKVVLYIMRGVARLDIETRSMLTGGTVWVTQFLYDFSGQQWGQCSCSVILSQDAFVEIGGPDIEDPTPTC